MLSLLIVLWNMCRQCLWPLTSTAISDWQERTSTDDIDKHQQPAATSGQKNNTSNNMPQRPATNCNSDQHRMVTAKGNIDRGQSVNDDKDCRQRPTATKTSNKSQQWLATGDSNSRQQWQRPAPVSTIAMMSERHRGQRPCSDWQPVSVALKWQYQPKEI